ncbi:MAG: rod shape-determining protein MreC, partial [Methanothrix sp.]
YLVSIGSNQGIKLGQPVIREGYLVGKVIEVRKESCVVRSVLSPLSIIQVWIPTLNEKGYLQGDGNTLTVKDITQGVAVPEGSLVESSGLGGTLPQGLLIGTTGKLLTEPSDLAQNYRLTPGTDPSNLESIMILLTD